MIDFTQIKAELLEKKEELTHRLSKIKAESNTPLNQSSKERAMEIKENDVTSGLEREGREELIQVDYCLEKIEAGDYGHCEDCGENIPLKRLQAIPFTPYCINCCEQREKERAAV